MRILILCTGNTCRSQMAEGFLKTMDPELRVVSAGTDPGKEVSPMAVRVMNEAGIDISAHRPKPVDQFLSEEFDYVLTVCDNAKEKCPYFAGKVHHRLHHGFRDPASATGTEEEVLAAYRKVRDQIRNFFQQFHTSLG